MSNSLNSVELIGYLGRDPESVSFQEKTVVRFPLATHDVWHHPNDRSLQTHTDWHRVVVMGASAQAVLTHLKKGSLVYVRGKLRTRRYHDHQDRPRFITEVIGLKFLFLNHPKETEAEPSDREPDGEWIENDDQSLVA